MLLLPHNLFFFLSAQVVCFLCTVGNRYRSLGGLRAISGTWNTNRLAVECDRMSNPDE